MTNSEHFKASALCSVLNGWTRPAGLHFWAAPPKPPGAKKGCGEEKPSLGETLKKVSTKEGIAVDARLVKSASKHVSKADLAKLREKRSTAEGKLDRKGNPLKKCTQTKSQFKRTS